MECVSESNTSCSWPDQTMSSPVSTGSCSVQCLYMTLIVSVKWNYMNMNCQNFPFRFPFSAQALLHRVIHNKRKKFCCVFLIGCICFKWCSQKCCSETTLRPAYFHHARADNCHNTNKWCVALTGTFEAAFTVFTVSICKQLQATVRLPCYNLF